MKRNFKFVLATIFTLITILPLFCFAQFNANVCAGFGVDGDIISGHSQNLNPTTTTSSFDWFKGPSNGIGVIDTTGASGYKSLLLASQNISFDKGMAFPRYSTQNGYLLLDARYGRDRVGNSGASQDITTFTTGSKNGDNPATWNTAPTGSTVSDKGDIIDSYIHLRRDGTIINNTNPSALILTLGVSTMGNTGNRYVDFEIFHNRIAYNTTTGAFSNSGPSSTGGHTPWTFSANGNVNSVGDMTVSYSYGTGGVTEVSIYIWVSQNVYNTVSPSKFSFVPYNFYGNSYGYAKVAGLTSNQFNAWASASSANTPGPSWGTSSKDAGMGWIYYSTNYAANDFGEVAIDLTSMGIDPALSTSGFDACIPPFTRVITKTRSSASFTSSLQDFSGPYEFLDAPVASPAIAAPSILNCSTTSTTLSPVSAVSGASYQWATTEGNIVATNGNNATINKPGKYYLTSAIVTGCPTRTDSTVVMEDKFQPVASGTVVGALIANNPLSTVTILGGDVNASNGMTPFGNSTGLNWDWKGPGTFAGITKNAVVTQPGDYTLILTEQRNGCSDTAVVPISASAGPLPVKYLSLNAVPLENKSVAVTWVTTEETNNNRFEIERSFDLNSFKKIAIVLDGFAAGTQKNYAYTDKSAELQNKTVIYYRLKQFDNDGRFTYSKIMTVKFKADAPIAMEVSPNPFIESLNVRYNATQKGLAQITIMEASGKTVMAKQTNINIGNNIISLNGLSNLQSGLYVAKLTVNGIVITTEKIIKR